MLTARDEQRLQGVHPFLVDAYRYAAGRAEQDGTPIFVVGGCRTAEFQNSLYQKGRGGNPGPIVTQCDGIHQLSDHQPKADGFGHAIDFAFVPTKERTDAFNIHWPWETIAGYAKGFEDRVQWGGTWKLPADLDHLQLV